MARLSVMARRVRRLIEELDGAAICDGCITDRLYLAERAQANAATRELGELDCFARGHDICATCGSGRIVISHTAVV